MFAALRRLGFDKVYDTEFAADLTIMEEGTELIHRIFGALGLKVMKIMVPYSIYILLSCLDKVCRR